MHTSLESAPPSGSAERGSAQLAITHIFLSPTRAFEEIRRGAPWLWPYLICVAIGLASALITAPAQEIVFQERMAQMQQKNPNLSPQAMEMTRKVTRVTGLVAVPIVFLALLAVAAGLFYLTSQLAGLNLTYKLIFRALAYAGLVSYGLAAIVGTALIYVKYRGGHVQSAADLTPQLGLDLLVSDGFLRGLLSTVNLFTIWWIVVLVYGFAVLAQRPRSAVLGPVLGAAIVWLLVLGLLAGWQMHAAAVS